MTQKQKRCHSVSHIKKRRERETENKCVCVCERERGKNNATLLLHKNKRDVFVPCKNLKFRIFV